MDWTTPFVPLSQLWWNPAIRPGYSSLTNLVVDENNIPETLYGSTGESIKGSLSAAQQVLTDGFENRSAGIYSAETGVINGTLNAIESAVNGLNDNVEETRKAVSGNYSGSTAALTEYGTKLGTFTPVLDSTAVNENVSKMNTNYSALQQEVLENNQSYQNYVNKVYETTGPVGGQGGIYCGGPDKFQIYIQEPWNLDVEIVDIKPLK